MPRLLMNTDDAATARIATYRFRSHGTLIHWRGALRYVSAVAGADADTRFISSFCFIIAGTYAAMLFSLMLEIRYARYNADGSAAVTRECYAAAAIVAAAS